MPIVPILLGITALGSSFFAGRYVQATGAGASTAATAQNAPSAFNPLNAIIIIVLLFAGSAFLKQAR